MPCRNASPRKWHVPASKVTIPEIRSRLNGQGEEVRAVFQAADEIAYCGKRFTAPDLRLWRDLVKKQLQQLAQTMKTAKRHTNPPRL